MLIGHQILLASPISVIRRLSQLIREPGFLSTVFFSLGRITGGFLLGLSLGVLLSAVSARFSLSEILLRPMITAMKTIPVASFIVVSLLWFHARNLSVFISFVMVFPVVYTNTLSGIRAMDPKLLEMAEIFRVPWYRKLRYLYLPEIASYLLSGSKVALGLAWKSGIAAEVIGIPRGSIGERLYNAKLYMDTEDLFAWTLVIVVVSLVFERLMLSFLSALLVHHKREVTHG